MIDGPINMNRERKRQREYKKLERKKDKGMEGGGGVREKRKRVFEEHCKPVLHICSIVKA